jgi:hypothetical protein
MQQLYFLREQIDDIRTRKTKQATVPSPATDAVHYKYVNKTRHANEIGKIKEGKESS